MKTESEKLENLQDFATKIGGKVWRKGGKTRIYLPGTQAVNVYIDWAAEDWADYESGMQGGCLKVYPRYENMNVKRETLQKTKHEAMMVIDSALQIGVCADSSEVILY